MSAPQSVECDERTKVVLTASHQLAYIVLFAGLMIDIAYRSMVRHEDTWDLIALLFASAAVGMIYKARHKVRLPRRVMAGMLIGVVVGGVILAIVTALAK